MDPEVSHEVTAGILILEHDTKDNLGRGRDILHEVVAVVGSQGELTRVDDDVQTVDTFLVVGRILGLGEPRVVVQIELGQLHICRIFAELTE